MTRYACVLYSIYIALMLPFLIQSATTSESLEQLTTEYVLDKINSPVFVCEYQNPLSSILLESSGIPCSSMYVNATVVNKLDFNFTAAVIEGINTLKVITGRRCYKLKLTTICIQKWFEANKISKETEALSHTRDECYDAKACVNCEVGMQYPSPICEAGTFGRNPNSKEVVFVLDTPVYQNLLGETSFGLYNTKDSQMYIGGDYKESVYFPMALNAQVV